jgi:IS5 family transposase
LPEVCEWAGSTLRRQASTLSGGILYEQAVPQNHFLRRLDRVIDWEAFGARLLALYEGHGEFGRPPYPPENLLKMLLLAYLYDLSEQQVEEWVSDRLAARCFRHRAADERAPDHTTLSALKARIVTRGQEECLRALLAEIIRQAQACGVHFGTLQIVDRTPVVANGNVVKEEARVAAGQPPRDGGARWGVKGKRVVRDAQGAQVVREEYFYGYKVHTSLNAEAEMITRVVVTAGNAPEDEQFAE